MDLRPCPPACSPEDGNDEGTTLYTRTGELIPWFSSFCPFSVISVNRSPLYAQWLRPPQE